MSDPQQLDRELRDYLEKEPNLRREDRLIYLKAIFHKHFEFNKLDHVVNKGDLYEIISGAKNVFTNKRLPLRISRKDVDQSDLPHISVIESFIGYLNRMNLVKKMIKFDYTD